MSDPIAKAARRLLATIPIATEMVDVVEEIAVTAQMATAIQAVLTAGVVAARLEGSTQIEGVAGRAAVCALASSLGWVLRDLPEDDLRALVGEFGGLALVGARAHSAAPAGDGARH